jgi:WD40 repeat protein
MWDAATAQELFTITPDTIATYIFSADGTRLITGSQNGTIEIWDANTGEGLLTIPTPYRITNWGAFDLSPDGKHIVAVSPERTLRMWDISIEGSREAFTLAPHDGAWVRRVRYSPDGTRLTTAGMDGTAKVFDAATGDELFTLSGHTDSIFGLAYSPDGTRLATASHDKTVKVWDAASGKLLMTLSKEGHGDGVYGGLFPGILDVAFSADGTRLASAGGDGTVVVWDAMTGKELFTLPSNGNGIINLAFSPDGTHLVTSSDGGFGFDPAATMWDLNTRQQVFTNSIQTGLIFGLTFTKDGSRFATGAGDGVLRIWDSQSGEELLALPGHTSTLVDIDFSADGQYIATAGFDGIAKIWDAETGKELLTLTGHTGGISGVSFSPDGTRLATSSRDGTVRVYLLNIEELIALAKSRLTRSLTREECQKYLHMEQCPTNP